MKPPRGLWGVSCVVLAISAIGCGSAVPLAPVQEAVFLPEFVGLWESKAMPDEESAQMLVLLFDEPEYYVELRETGSAPFDEEKAVRLRAFLSDLDGKTFVNAQTIDSADPDDRLFYFYTCELDEQGALLLTELQDVDGQDLDAFETSEALRAFIRAHLDDPGLYGQTIVFQRVPE